MTDIKDAVYEICRNFINFESQRQKFIDTAVKLRAQSKIAINYIVHGNIKEGKKSLEKANKTARKLHEMLAKMPFLYAVLQANDCMDEFIEASMLYGYLKKMKSTGLSLYSKITPESLMAGVCDMTGELVRIARVKPDVANSIVRDVQQIYSIIANFPITRNSKTRLKLSELERNISKLEEIVTTSRRESIEKQQIEKFPLDGEKRPWGHFEILMDTPDYKVKRITVMPGQRLSLQRHRKRREHWIVVCGTGVVTIDEKISIIKRGECIDIPRGSFHRIKNRGKKELVFIEVQTGEYFGEDDIERLEDDYGRV